VKEGYLIQFCMKLIQNFIKHPSFMESLSHTCIHLLKEKQEYNHSTVANTNMKNARTINIRNNKDNDNIFYIFNTSIFIELQF
jgi:hypothetical protein